MNKKLSVFKILKRILPEVASISPKLFVFNYLLFIFNSFLNISAIFATQFLFDKVSLLWEDKTFFKSALLAVGLLLIIKILKEVIDGVSNFIAENYDLRTGQKFIKIINLKVSKVEPINFEDSNFLDNINKAYQGIKPVRVLVNLTMDLIMSYGPYFIFLSIYLFRLRPLLMVSLILIFIPVLLNQVVRSKLFSDVEDLTALIRRKRDYYSDCITDKKYAKETRTLGASSYFLNLFKESIENINNITWKVNLKINIIELFLKLLSLLGYVGILLLLYNSLVNNIITVGAFAAVFASIDSMFTLMEQVVCYRIPECVNKIGALRNLLNFLDLEEEGRPLELNESIKRIDLQNVSFSYPNSNKYVIDNINLVINKGETIALVGENGSGKSTLLRIITGLYSPNRGEVYYNNNLVEEISYKSLFKNTSAVFQNFQKYAMTLYDNVRISDMANTSEEKINDSVLNSGLNLESRTFADGYNTMLSKEFNGIDLSGGEWQKVAISRGLNKEHEIIILDEPTSAIDPIEEINIYKKFYEICKDKTAFIVTHRLGSVKFADKVIVMNKGKVEAFGNHEELMNKCEIYKKMWDSQSKNYSEVI